MNVVATAGHVDHGKSTLVKALTGIDPDRFTEEKARGLTIDLGFTSTTLPSGKLLSIIDVPGHIRFIKNMLAGVGTVGACLFVVAATEGWKPQSEEHLRILELLGIKHGIIALTKSAIAESDLIELASVEILEKVSGTFLDGVPIVVTDALTGLGIDDLIKKIDTLLLSTQSSSNRTRPRLWIDRVFAAKGAGTVVTGTLTGGSLQIGDEIEIYPAGIKARIRMLQNHYQEVEKISGGARCALNLVGVSHSEIKRGDVLIRPSQWHLTTVADASLQILDRLDHSVSRRGAHVIYIGSGEYPIQMRILGPEVLEPGQEGAVRLFLPCSLPMLPGDRFILRESGRSETLGGGSILDVDPQERASRAQPNLSIDRVIRERGWIDAKELERLTGEHRDPNVRNWVVDPTVLKSTTSELQKKIEEAGPLGVELSSLNDHQKAVAELLDGTTIEGGRIVIANMPDPFINHPFVATLEAFPFSPPNSDHIDRAELRELVKRKQIIEESGVFFAASAVEKAGHLAAVLLDEKPKGFTVSEFRDKAANTRKHAIPLLALLDSVGVTRRRGDLRIAGPRLPVTGDQID